jgi:hypothetical protein
MSADPEIQAIPATPAAGREAANALRALAMDAVQKANSGRPGMPMGMAEIAEVLWRRHLRLNPANPGVARSRPLRALRLDADPITRDARTSARESRTRCGRSCWQERVR